MKTGFHVSNNLALPVESATWVLSVIAKRDAGKTYNACVLAEEMLKNKIPIIAIDGMGVWWGLRVSKDGKGDGLPIIVFGGDHADLPLIPDKAALIARSIVESGVSAVIDVSPPMSRGQSRRVVADFVRELYRVSKTAGIRHIFIEESDLWAPQKAIGDVAVTLGAIDDLVRRGGNYNLGCTLITQRSAVLNKDVLTQSDCLIILRTLAPQDKAAIQAWVERVSEESKSKLHKWYDSLNELKRGEAYVWHPDEPKIFLKTKFRERETLHATREFLRSPEIRKVKMMDVSEFINKFRNVFEPKPKPVQSSVPIIRTEHPKQPYTPMSIPTHTPRFIPSDIPKFTPAKSDTTSNMPKITPQSSDTIATQQILPNIILEKIRPNVQLPADLLENPPTPLARVLVILTNHESRDDRWTGSKIRLEMQKHAWPWDDISAAIDELIRWEILRKQSNNYLRFYRDRVQVVERSISVEAQ
jgi:hypothetical protein